MKKLFYIVISIFAILYLSLYIEKSQQNFKDDMDSIFNFD